MTPLQEVKKTGFFAQTLLYVVVFSSKNAISRRHDTKNPVFAVESYIDSEGNVIKFKHDLRIPFTSIAVDRGIPPYTAEQLFREFGYQGKRLKTLDTDTLQEMTALIEPAMSGAYREPVTTIQCFDGGGTFYTAYLYNIEEKTHTPVDLTSMGPCTDWENTSDEGQLLLKQLREIYVEAGYFSNVSTDEDPTNNND